MKYNIYRKTAIILAFILIFQTVAPTISWALTSGPSQPEFSSFEPINTTEMVDLFTGDFTYNIPLLEVPGPNGSYPINLFYHSVTNVEEEASMVGLGWNIGVGAITRQIRGIPDDFNGEEIKRTVYLKKDWTAGARGAIGFEFFGIKNSNINFSVSGMYNSYKGVGLSGGVDLTIPIDGGLGANFGAELNTFDGLNYHGGLKYTHRLKKAYSLGGSIGFSGNSIEGVKSIGLSTFISKAKKISKTNKENVTTETTIHNQLGSTHFEFSDRPTFLPSYDLSYKGFNLDMFVSGGPEVFGGFPYGGFGGFYNENRLIRNGKCISHNSYGYMYLSEGQDKLYGLLDFNRTRDLPIIKHQQNLAVPVGTEDYYSLSGHGTGGVFKLRRSDIGVFRDKRTIGRSTGFTVTVEGGVGALAELGGSVTASFGVTDNDISDTEAWNEADNNGIKFVEETDEPSQEPFYFEHTNNITGEIDDSIDPNNPKESIIKEDYSYNDGEELVEFDLNKGGLFEFGSVSPPPLSISGTKIRNVRKPRSENIEYYTGNQIISESSVLIPHFDLKVQSYVYYDGPPEEAPIQPILISPATLDNTTKIPVERSLNDQITAFTQLTGTGMRYNYGLPVYNYIQKETSFSIGEVAELDICNPIIDIPTNEDGTINHTGTKASPDMLDIKETPQYAHSYLLTSILGPDYIDTDLSDGPPNEKDKGYWVVIDYAETNNKSNPYIWREPFYGATLNTGLRTLSEDNKAQFIYGEREQYYPVKIQTATHNANFEYSKKEDGRGANQFIQNSDSDMFGASTYKLDNIKLYKNRAISETSFLIKTILFSYSNSLCPDVYNFSQNGENIADGTGKLTLKKVEIKNLLSEKGKLNPYQFKYFNSDNNSYPYNKYQYDRWGLYKTSDNLCRNIYEPYTNQNESEETRKGTVQAWHLSQITLPSGSDINIEIGRDHYGYVQNRVATQMFKIAGIGSVGDFEFDYYNTEDLKIFFKFNQQYDGSDDEAGKDKYMKKYFEDLYHDPISFKKQIYFKILSEVYNYNNIGSNEFVTGAAYLENGDYGNTYGMETNKNYGWIKVSPIEANLNNLSTNALVHPFQLYAWQFLKSNLRSLLVPFTNLETDTNEDKKGTISWVADNSKKIVNIFRGFYKNCTTLGYGANIDEDFSYIRLCSPTKKKYGGGVRVEKISMGTQWEEEDTPLYGLVYKYDKQIINPETNETEETISSGVATNEPMIGSEENAIYYLKNTKRNLMFSTDENRFEQHPYNDNYYPASNIGYSKITVRSLASEYHLTGVSSVIGTEAGPPTDGISSTGEIVHEFYTCNDFPVITEESKIKDDLYSPKKLLIPFVGFINIDSYTGSKAYKVEINDMHGKRKKITYFGQEKNGVISTIPASSIEYQYYEKEYRSENDPGEFYRIGKASKKRRRLNNTVKLLIDYKYNDMGKANIKSGRLGMDINLITDLRFKSSRNTNAGVDINTNVIPITLFPFVIPSVLPIFKYNNKRSETGVTNKVIKRIGILKKIIASDGLSTVVTENKVFDPYTGNAVLKTVTNQYEDEIYQYNIPAHMVYKRMGAAYKNWGENITLDRNEIVFCTDDCNASQTIISGLEELDLIPGDELILTRIDGDDKTKTRATFLKKKEGPYGCINEQTLGHYFSMEDMGFITENSMLSYNFRIIRSGNKNKLFSTAQQITSLLDDPTTSATINTTAGGEIVNPDGSSDVFSDMKDYTLDNVIDATSYTYSDCWDGNKLNYFNNDDRPYKNMFIDGLLGTYRMKSVLKYKTIRKYNNNGNPIDHKSKGVYDNFSFYNWSDTRYPYSDSGKRWLNTNEITKYSQSGQPLETKNALGIYNAALMVSLKDKMEDGEPTITTQYRPTHMQASSSNSRHNEMANANFENEITYSSKDSYEQINSNFCIFQTESDDPNEEKNYFTEEKYNSIGSTVISGSIVTMIIDKPYTYNPIFIGGKCELYVPGQLDESDESYNYLEGTINGIELFPFNGKNYTKLTINVIDDTNCFNSTQINEASEVVLSRIFNGNSSAPSKYTINYDNYHTGIYSLKIEYGGPSILPQRSLELTNGKKYHFSCWVYANSIESDLNEEGIAVTIDQNEEGPITFIPIGNRIEGWQKIEGDFVFDNETNDEVHLNFLQGELDIYIDDIRIHPSESQMTSYVYKINTGQLTHILDENNYFTKYLYDENGELFGILKETEDGIKTIQESRTHLIEHEEP